jgi:hypothetical protein
VIELATKSVAVRHVLLRAFSMLVSPTALFHPRILLRVLYRMVVYENPNGNHRRNRTMDGRQPVPENRLVS